MFRFLRITKAVIRGCLSGIKHGMKLSLHRAKWKADNRHNRTIAANLFPRDKVSVGKGTYGHLHIHSYGAEEERLTIGHYCSIAGDVNFILSGEHNYKRVSTYPFAAYYGKTETDAFAKGPIVVEDDVWIGFGATVLSGVRIGRGAVIGAGSVITKDVPPYAVVSGYNHVMKYRFPQEIIDRLMKIDYEKIDPEAVRKSTACYEAVTLENVDALTPSFSEEGN